MTSKNLNDKERIIELAKAGVRPKILAKFFGHTPGTISMFLTDARKNGEPIKKFVNGTGGLSEEAVLLYLDGLTPNSIAKQLGCPASTVYWAIKVTKDRGLPIDETPHGIARADQVIVRIKEKHAFAISKEAKRRGMTPTDLANRVITAVLTDNLFDAVLDEDAPESTSQKGASHVH